jgi:His/Glu/Gln/Arg/opine family amino acid ABC transporter permease subunit
MSKFLASAQKTIYLNFVYEDRYKFLIEGFLMTLGLTLATFILGTILGALVCRLMFSKKKGIAKATEQVKTLFIRLPSLVLLIIFAYAIFGNTSLSTVVICIIALSIKAAAYISDIMYSAVTTVDKGEIEAARTLGMSRFKAFRLVTLPQAVTSALPVYKNQLVITMQETSLVGFLAVMDLTRASSVISSRTMNPFLSVGITAITYVVIGWAANLAFNSFGKARHLGPADLAAKGGKSA